MTWESHLPAVLGVNRNELRELRQKHLVEGKDWRRDGKRVVYDLGAVEKLRGILSIPAEKIAPERIVAQCEALQKTETFLCWRNVLVNRRLIEVYRPGTDPMKPENLLWVRVSRSENFARNMVVKARLLYGKIYELAGGCPRRKGKW